MARRSSISKWTRCGMRKKPSGASLRTTASRVRGSHRVRFGFSLFATSWCAWAVELQSWVSVRPPARLAGEVVADGCLRLILTFLGHGDWPFPEVPMGPHAVNDAANVEVAGASCAVSRISGVVSNMLEPCKR